jgi:hypothetical protein
MSDQEKAVESIDARKAFMDGIISPSNPINSTTAELALETPEVKTDEKVEDKGEGKAKKTAQERIIELAHQRKEAEQRERDARLENEELRLRLKALEASVSPINVPKEPKKYEFSSEEEYINALTDYKVDRRISEREESQRQAKQAAEMQEIDNAYLKTVQLAQTRYEDFQDVVSKASQEIPPFMVMAIKESSVGGDLTYYLARFPGETKKILAMRPIQALKYITQLEHELLEPVEPTEKAKPSNKKAPEPITPVRGISLSDMSSPAKNFEEYKARRQKEKRR